MTGPGAPSRFVDGRWLFRYLVAGQVFHSAVEPTFPIYAVGIEVVRERMPICVAGREVGLHYGDGVRDSPEPAADAPSSPSDGEGEVDNENRVLGGADRDLIDDQHQRVLPAVQSALQQFGDCDLGESVIVDVAHVRLEVVR